MINSSQLLIILVGVFVIALIFFVPRIPARDGHFQAPKQDNEMISNQLTHITSMLEKQSSDIQKILKHIEEKD